jgi:small ligand-binding sensory domain FIST
VAIALTSGYHTPVLSSGIFFAGPSIMSSATSAALACASALSTLESTEAALHAAAAGALECLGGTPDLAILFISPHHARSADSIAPDACELLGTDNVLGCTGESIVGSGREIEEEPALSLWLARWPGAKLTPMHLEFERTSEGGVLEGWPEQLAGDWPAGSFLIVLGEPFSFPADYLLERLNEDRPGVPVIGGMASGAPSPGENRLFLGGHTHAEGAVALHVCGGVKLRTIVSQGCRPIGRPLVVTKAERNLIFELGGKPAFAQLREIFNSLPTSEQQLVQRALHVGRVVSEYQDRFEQGDFLVRNVVGIDSRAGAIAIGDYIRPGQTIQFHIRDEAAASAELAQLLAAARNGGSSPAGGLLFTCNGRGTRMFSEPHHDAAAIARAFSNVPLAGFFAQGEIGPIGRQNFMHGFTASIALFEAESN